MTPIQEIVALYFRAWNAQTLAECAGFLERSCAPAIAYSDPKYTCHGVAELAARIHKSRLESPMFRVEVASALDGYDDTYRYGWVLDIEVPKLTLPGLDVIVRGKDGRIAAITSFFGPLEESSPPAPLRVQRFGA